MTKKYKFKEEIAFKIFVESFKNTNDMSKSLGIKENDWENIINKIMNEHKTKQWFELSDVELEIVESIKLIIAMGMIEEIKEEPKNRNDVNTWLNKLPQINKSHWNYYEEVEHNFKNIGNYANYFENALKQNESVGFDYLEEKLNFIQTNLDNIRNICLTWKKAKGKN